MLIVDMLAGAKRLQALSTLVVAVMILPWALWQLSTQVVRSLSLSLSHKHVLTLYTSHAITYLKPTFISVY